MPLSTQLLLISLLSVRVSHKDQSLVFFYLFCTLLLVLSYLTHPSVIYVLMTINFSFLLSPLNSPTFHTFQPQLFLSLSGCLPIFFHLICPKRSFSSLVFLLNFPKSPTPVFSCHLTPSLHQRSQRAILVSSLILLYVLSNSSFSKSCFLSTCDLC